MTICLFSKGITVHCLSIVSVWWLVVINIFAPLPPTVTSMSITSSVDLREKTVGFLGVGKITSCVVKGLCSPAGIIPKRIYLSPRNKDKATALQSEFPDNVEIASSNEDVVSKSDIVFIGLLPQVAKEILPSLDFTDKEVISMMATIDIGDLLSLTKRPVDSAVRTVPLPSSQYREGPCLVHPPIPRFLSILSSFSTPIPCIKESEMKPMVALTGHISSFFELMNETEKFMLSKGVSREAARPFISSFYTSLAKQTERSVDTYADMAEEAATPGGLNEQTLKAMKETEHYSIHSSSLESILNRLEGK